MEVLPKTASACLQACRDHLSTHQRTHLDKNTHVNVQMHTTSPFPSICQHKLLITLLLLITYTVYTGACKHRHIHLHKPPTIFETQTHSHTYSDSLINADMVKTKNHFFLLRVNLSQIVLMCGVCLHVGACSQMSGLFPYGDCHQL